VATDRTNSITPIQLDTAIDVAARQCAAQFSTGRKCGPTIGLLGKAGTGKTGQIENLPNLVGPMLGVPAEEIYFHNFDLLSVHFMDISGADVPDTTTNTLTRYRPSTMVLPSKNVLADYKHVILFVDEIDKGPDENRQAISPLLLANRLGLLDLPYDRFFVIAAGNDTASKSGGVPLFLHNVNRMNLMHVVPSVRRWLSDFAPNQRNHIPPMARAFVETQSVLFTDPADLPTTPNTPFLTLRSFTEAVRALPYLLPLGTAPKDLDPLDPHIFDRILSNDMRPLAEAAIAGIMGSAAATQYLNYARNHHLIPTRADVETNPAGAKLPTYSQDPSAVHACAAYVLSWLGDTTTKLTRAQLDAYGRYIMRFDATKRVDLMFAAASKVQAFTMTKAYGEFIADPANQALAGAVMRR
jgi:hypothetical protein